MLARIRRDMNLNIMSDDFCVFVLNKNNIYYEAAKICNLLKTWTVE